MKRWAIIFGLFMVLIIILADTGHRGALPKVYDFPYGDKVGHFTLFGLLSFVINLTSIMDKNLFTAEIRNPLRKPYETPRSQRLR